MCGRIVIFTNCSTVRKHLDHRMHLVKSNVHVVTGSNLTIQSDYRTSRIPRYCCPNHHRSASMFHCWSNAFKMYRLPWAFSKPKPGMMLGTMWRTTHLFPVTRCPCFMIITPSFSPYSTVFSNQKLSNCTSTVDVGSVKLSDHFCKNWVFKMNIQFWCQRCCSISVIFRNNPLQCMAIPFI